MLSSDTGPKQDLEIELIGRKQEMKDIMDMVRDSSDEKEGMVLIEGEAGIGKTRLLQEIEVRSNEKRYQVLSGSCFHYRRDPLTPFIDMIRDMYGIDSSDLDDEVKDKIRDRIKEDLKDDSEKIDGIMGLIETDGQLHGGYIYEEPDHQRIIDSLISGGTKIMMISSKDPEHAGSVEEGMITYHRLGKGGEEKLDPRRIELITGLIKEFIEGNRHSSVIISPLEELVSSNPKRKLGNFIKITNEITRSNDGSILFGRSPGSDLNFQELQDLDEQRIMDLEKGKRSSDMKASSPNETISSLLLSKTKEQPVILLIEDLQWADEPTLNLMQYLARDAKANGLFIIGTYRSEELNLEDKDMNKVPLRDALQRMTRERLFKTMKLGRLNRDSTKEMVRSVLNESPGNRLVEEVWKESKGNPLYILNYLKADIQGIDKNKLGEQKPIDPKEMVSIRLRSIKEDERAVLDLVSILSVDTKMERISNILDMDQGRILDIMDGLLELKFLKEKGDEFEFEHEKIRQAVYDLMDDKVKQKLHKKVAIDLSKDLDMNDPGMQSRLSEHYIMGGQHGEALKTILDISREHWNELPLDVALTLLNKGNECIDHMEQDSSLQKNRIEILQKRADIEEKLGRLVDSMGSLLEAVQIGETMRLTEGLSRSYRQIGDLKLKLFKWDQTIDFYLKSLHMSKKEKDQIEIAKAFRGLGSIYFLKGDYSRSMECYLKYMEFPADRMGSTNFDAMIDIGDIYYQMGDFNQSLTYYKLAIKKAEDVADTATITKGYIKMARVLLRLGEVDDTLRFADHAYSMVDTIIKKSDYQNVLLNYMELMIEIGEIDKAEESLGQLNDFAGVMTDRLLEAQKHRVVGIFLSKRRDFKGSIRHMREALTILEEINTPFQKALTYFHFGLIRFQQMDVDGALELLAKANSIFKKIKALHYLNRTSSKVREVSFIKEGLKT